MDLPPNFLKSFSIPELNLILYKTTKNYNALFELYIIEKINYVQFILAGIFRAPSIK